MKQFISHISVLVDDYDQAIVFYTGILGFELLEDTPLEQGKRWVVARPKGASECSCLLAKAANQKQKRSVGNQAGGRVFLFLRTDDFWRDYLDLKHKGVAFTREPKTEPYGTVAVFQDPFGNLWDLIGPNSNNLN